MEKLSALAAGDVVVDPVLRPEIALRAAGQHRVRLLTEDSREESRSLGERHHRRAGLLGPGDRDRLGEAGPGDRGLVRAFRDGRRGQGERCDCEEEKEAFHVELLSVASASSTPLTPSAFHPTRQDRRRRSTGRTSSGARRDQRRCTAARRTGSPQARSGSSRRRLRPVHGGHRRPRRGREASSPGHLPRIAITAPFSKTSCAR